MKLRPAGRLVPVLSCLAWTVGVGLLYFAGFVPLRKAELMVQDHQASHGRLTPPNPGLVFVGINKLAYRDVDWEQDEDARQAPVLRRLGEPYPWSREVWAEAVEKLVGAGARVVVLDLVFAAEGPGDDRLAAVLDRHRDRVVVAGNISDFREAVGTVQEGVALSFTLPNETLIPVSSGESAAFDPRVGYANIWADWDGVFRRPRYRVSHQALTGFPGDRVHESLAARTLRRLGRADRLPPVDAGTPIRFTAPPGRGFPPLALDSLFRPKQWASNYGGGAFFRDKVVFIGPAANVFHDEHRTPFPGELMLGPEIHLNLINAALHGEYLRDAPPGVDLALLLAAGLVSLWLWLRVAQPLRRLALLLGLSLAAWLGAGLLHDHAGLLVPALISPLLVLNGSGLTALLHDLVREQVERARVRRTLERYVSKNIVQELLDNPQTYFQTLGGVRRPVTVLFSDVRNFTSMTEGANEEQLVLQLNEYFTEMVRHVFAHRGTLDKFIGDAVMAVWGNIVTHGPAADARDAVATALEMKQSLARLNEGWRQRGWPALEFGIGINHGEAVVANLGSTEKMELSVIGDAVNLGSRLEGLTKEFHLDLLIGESVARLVEDQYLLRPVHLVQVKGRTRPVEVFAVLGERGTPEGVPPPWLEPYLEGLRRYRERDFTTALDRFEAVRQLVPEDYIAALYVRDCREFLATPPPPGWNGVFVMRSK